MNKKYENQDFKSFSEILRQFLVDAHLFKPPIAACLAVAGPVDNNVVRFTNRGSWTIDGDQIAQEFGIKVVELVNDFVAAGYGVLTLDEAAECVKLQDAPKVLDAPIACIGAGTGLGECFLTPGTDGSYQCYPTEGGHSEFAPRDDVRFTCRFFITSLSQSKCRFYLG